MRFACLLADGFEDVEALGSAALMRRAGFEVDFYSVYNKKKVMGSYKTVVTDILPMKKLEPEKYDGLFIPGGKAAFRLRDEKSVKAIVQEFNQLEKWMLAICAAPTVYGMMGLLDNKRYISYPGTEKEMGKAIRVERKAVHDGRFITAISAGAIYDFVFEIIKTINGEKALESFKKNIYY
ncbi:MAG: DJ-1/PfpI family protein [Candidatus Izimaplasma sp.]|nr:DJ-1/PfpI family protein [Candidatus Izimaplasma bacterium]